MFKDTKRIPSIDDQGAVDFERGYNVDFIRAYFDGLIVNFDLNSPLKAQNEGVSSFICEGCTLGIPTLPAHESIYLNDIYHEIGMPVGGNYLAKRIVRDSEF